MKITKVIPQVVKIDTNLIKRNDIYNVTDTLGTYGQRNYIVVNVTNDIIVLRLLEAKKDSELIIRVEDVDRYKFKKMKLVEECEHLGYLFSDTKPKYNKMVKEMTLEEIERELGCKIKLKPNN